jgi:hypothetical protein
MGRRTPWNGLQLRTSTATSKSRLKHGANTLKRGWLEGDDIFAGYKKQSFLESDEKDWFLHFGIKVFLSIGDVSDFSLC